jgi:hypothetical protein
MHLCLSITLPAPGIGQAERSRHCCDDTSSPVIPAIGQDRKQASICATAAKSGHYPVETDNRAGTAIAHPAAGRITSDKMAQAVPAKGGNTK